MRGNINGQCKSVYPGLPRHAGSGVAAGAVATPAPKVVEQGEAGKCPFGGEEEVPFFIAVTCRN